MPGAFRKISRVGSLMGGTKWYLSEDCLLAAKRIMYTVEYRRFYLRDLESITVWPSRLWRWRLIIPAVALAAVGASFWVWINTTAGAVFGSIGLAWLALELIVGPTAKSRIQTTGATVDLPIVSRTRRARKVLAKVDAAVRAARDIVEQPGATTGVSSEGEPNIQGRTEASASAPVAAAVETNGS